MVRLTFVRLTLDRRAVGTPGHDAILDLSGPVQNIRQYDAANDEQRHHAERDQRATPARLFILRRRIGLFVVHSGRVTLVDMDSGSAALEPMSRTRAITAALMLLTFCGVSLPVRAQSVLDRWFTTNDGARLHYEEAGRGPTLVFIPGWTMPAWIWQAQVAEFSRRYHVIALDPRAQGQSDITATGYDQDRRGEDIAELIGHVSPYPVVLVGWSLGVLDALAYVHQYGDQRLAGLVLIDNSVGEDPPPAPERIEVVSNRLRPHRPVPREVSMRAFVTGMFERAMPASYIDRLTETCLRTPLAVARELLSYPVPRTYWRDAVYSVRKPVLYLVRPRFAGQAANLGAHQPYAETIVLNNVGHAMFVEEPDRFNEILRTFLTRRVWQY